MPTVAIRSLPVRPGTVLIGLATAGMPLTIGLVDGVAHGLYVLAWAGLLIFPTWLLWQAPQITLAPRALTIRNAWRTHVLGWDEVGMCRIRWGLSVVTRDNVEVRASAAPRRGSMVKSFRRHQELREQQERHDGPRDTEPAPAVRPECLVGEETYHINLDTGNVGAFIGTHAEQARSLLARVMGDTAPDETVGVTGNLNHPAAAAAGLLAIVLMAVIVLL